MSMTTADLMLKDFPERIETERLILRIPQPHDGQIIYDVIMESRDEIKVFLDWASAEQRPEYTEEHMRVMSARFILRTDYPFSLWERTTGEFIGMCSAHIRNEAVGEYEIGYWLGTSKTGQGYMTEAVNALTAYLFEYAEAGRLFIRCDKENTASANVAKRAGYTYEGCLRAKEANFNGGTRDMLYFSKLRGE